MHLTRANSSSLQDTYERVSNGLLLSLRTDVDIQVRRDASKMTGHIVEHDLLILVSPVKRLFLSWYYVQDKAASIYIKQMANNSIL